MASKSAKTRHGGFFDDLVRCETRLYNAVGETLRAEHGIGTSQFEFLRYLRDHPGARVADIATAFAAGVGAISKGGDRLVAAGWAFRSPNPADGRSSLLSLTSAGEVLVAEAEETFDRRLDELISSVVDPGDLEVARSALSELRRAFEANRVGLPIG
ncbi:MarR family transcriptional regulator [Planctomonas sp. JC2975]|uniref:MarR family winged helix-turn-helix transcriptional regulator n=1 Tax=Planctomonas sp. JC2975 TaxID=2729626 RepID=UPI003211F2C9